MFNNLQITQYLQQLYSFIGYQAERIVKLEQSIEALQNDMASLKGKPPIHIDKIEYKFDQLKVERLDGTLTIGVSPGGIKSIEDMAVNGKNIYDLSPQSIPEAVWEIRQEVQRFLDEEALNEIQQLEIKYNRKLSDDFHLRMIEDVRKQMDQRLQYYLNQADPAAAKEGAPLDKQRIIDKLKHDIRLALNNYYLNLLKKGS